MSEREIAFNIVFLGTPQIDKAETRQVHKRFEIFPNLSITLANIDLIADATGAFIVYDVNQSQIDEFMQQWIDQIRAEKGENIPIVILANIDNFNDAVPSLADVQHIFKAPNVVGICRVSEKEGSGLDEAYKLLSYVMLKISMISNAFDKAFHYYEKRSNVFQRGVTFLWRNDELTAGLKEVDKNLLTSIKKTPNNYDLYEFLRCVRIALAQCKKYRMLYGNRKIVFEEGITYLIWTAKKSSLFEESLSSALNTIKKELYITDQEKTEISKVIKLINESGEIKFRYTVGKSMVKNFPITEHMIMCLDQFLLYRYNIDMPENPMADIAKPGLIGASALRP